MERKCLEQPVVFDVEFDGAAGFGEELAEGFLVFRDLIGGFQDAVAGFDSGLFGWAARDDSDDVEDVRFGIVTLPLETKDDGLAAEFDVERQFLLAAFDADFDLLCGGQDEGSEVGVLGNGLATEVDDHVTGSQASVVGGAAGHHASDLDDAVVRKFCVVTDAQS